MKLKKMLARTLGMLLAGAMVMTGGVSMFANADDSTVVTYGVASCYKESDVASMTVNGTKVPIIKFLSNYDHAQFSFDGTANIEITVNENIETYSVSPLAKNIKAKADGKKLSFSITESVYMIVKINGIKEIVVIADDLETDVPSSSGKGIYNILNDYNADPTGESSVVNSLQSAIDDANGAGGGIVYVPQGLYKLDGNIFLRSNVHLYLEGGAVIRSVTDRANYVKHSYKDSLKRDVTWTFYNELGAENIKIYGRGMIDGQGHDMLTGEAKLLATLFYFRQADNIVMDGIVVRDGNFWTIEPKMCDGCEFTNLKVLNDFADMTENDAIDICESRDVLVKHMLAISEDDTYSTKTYTYNGVLSGETTVKNDLTLDNVTFDDCFGWTHCGTFKVGDGSNFTQSNVTFKNSYSYKCMQAIKVSHAYGSSDFTDILFDNIDIEGYGGRSATDRRWLFIDTFSGTAEDNGNVEGLTIKNINIRELGSRASTMKGREKQAYVKNVTFENISVPGQTEYASSLEEMNITDINIQGTSDYKILPVDNSEKYDTAGNIALTASASASSTESNNYSAKNAIDGNLNTRWTSGASDSEWFTLDFGKTTEFNRVRIVWEAAYATGYKIQYSDNNSSWKDIITVTDGDGGTDIIDFERISGRYIRFLGTKRVEDKNGFSFYEFEVYNHDDYNYQSLPTLIVQTRLAKRDYPEATLKQYTSESASALRKAISEAEAVVNGDSTASVTETLRNLTNAKYGLVKKEKPASEYNLALGRPVTASGIQNDSSKATNAVDGKIGSCWRSQTTDAPYTLTVDLGQNSGYDLVAINWEDTYATLFKLCVSNDNQSWTDITGYLSAQGKVEQLIYLDEVQNYRYIRMYCVQKASEWGVGIYEFEVYDSKNQGGTVEDTPKNENLALNKSATASSYDPSYAPTSAIDGSTAIGSRWGRNAANKVATPHWFKVDLGNAYDINTVKIVWENLPESMNIEVSENDQDWTTVVNDAAPQATDFTTDSGEIKSQTVNTFDDIKARYVRINMTAQNFDGNYYLSFFEFEVYNVAEDPVDDPTDDPADDPTDDPTDDPVEKITKGDVNGDGKINSTDFMQVRRHFLNIYTIPDKYLEAADVNGDGNINSTDFMQIRRHFLGLYTIVA